MPDTIAVQRPIAAAIAVVCYQQQLLLVRRAHKPDAGLWGFPGGKIEYGEPLFRAAERELQEETQIIARAQSILTSLDIIGPNSEDGTPQYHYLLSAVRCQYLTGKAIACDDADEVAWFTIEQLRSKRAACSQHVLEVAELAVGTTI